VDLGVYWKENSRMITYFPQVEMRPNFAWNYKHRKYCTRLVSTTFGLSKNIALSKPRILLVGV